MFDKYRLEYEMKKRGVTREMLCEALGICLSAFHRKCSGRTEWTLREINIVVDYLDLGTPMGVFFADKVS